MNPNRPDARTDLTRWNRAGLSRLAYVDGDAASWLEELRLALFAHYLRGAPPADRLPERWRDVFLAGRPAGGDPTAPPQHPDLTAKPNATWPDATLMARAAAVQWARLAPQQPPRVETPGQRQSRLLAQYRAAPDGDPAWEITRAFARAAHLVLGHLNAFAGEGYLRTATQWDNLRRLAAMVNYQPGPPASALVEAALALKPEVGAVTVARGLAAKYAPPTGGPPLIFETLADLTAHPELNAARPKGWDVNATPLDLGPPGAPRPVSWLAGPRDRVAPGDLVVLAFGAEGQEGRARSVIAAMPGEGLVTVTLDDGVNASVQTHRARLWVHPAEVRRGEAQTGGARLVVETKGLAAAQGDVLRIRQTGGSAWSVTEVLEARGEVLVLRALSDLTQGAVEMQPLSPLSADAEGWVNTSTNVRRVYFSQGQGVTQVKIADEAGFRVNQVTLDGKKVTTGFGYQPPEGRARRGYVVAEAEAVAGTIRPSAVQVVSGVEADPDRTVAFLGKPPKGLAAGAWMVGRHVDSGAVQPLRVQGVTQGSGLWHVLFRQRVEGAHDRVEFHGPLTQALRPLGHDRNPDPAAPDGTIRLAPLSEAATALLKPGRRVIFSRPGQDLATALTGVERLEGALRLSVATPLPADWAAHETTLRMNVATLGHGEAKGARLLGSGDAERPEQVFRLAVKEISHIPGAAVVAGVVPDVDVAVDGRVWPLSDLTDPAADGTQSWSPALNEEGELMIHFRRRLPTGTNNVTVLRHRVGTGARGSGVPPFALKEPMRKHPFVQALHQPFPSAGGADRESVAAMRVSTPSRLSANGRAVSAEDLGRVAESHAQVWKARAEELTEPGRLRRMRLTLVAANGDPLTPALTGALRPAILARAVPGIALEFADFGPLVLHLAASVRADLTSFDAGDVAAACIDALTAAFALTARGFGQPVYLAEILAALEAVPQVETATVQSMGLGAGIDLTQPRPPGFAGPWPAHVALRDGAVAAIFPAAAQVAFVPAPGQPYAQGTVSVTVQDIRP